MFYKTTKKISLNYISLFLLVVFSTWYITKLPFSPVYVFSFLGALIGLAILSYRPVLKIDAVISLSFLVVFYFCFTQIVILKPNVNTFLNVVFSIIVFIFIRILIPPLSTVNLFKLSRFLIYFSMPLLVFESFYRILNPPQERLDFYIESGMEDIIFYAYKMNSIMFQDSNFVAMLVLVLFFFSLYLVRSFHSRFLLFYSAVLFFLLLATLSRAAIIASLVFILLIPLSNFFYRNRKFVLLLFLIILPFMFSIAFKMSDFDGSFASKFHIINQTIKFIKDASLVQILFGVGFGNAVEVLNIGSHNLFVAFLVESGFIGLVLIILLWHQILLKSNYAAGIVMFPFLLAGMSFASLAMPYLYVVFSIILELESRKCLS